MKIIITNKESKYYLYEGKLLKDNGNTCLVRVFYFDNLLYDKKPVHKDLELKREEFIFHKDYAKEVPKGSYCYFGTRAPGDKNYKPCPYWNIDSSKPDQSCGECKLLGEKDWEDDGMGLLWDQVKSCGINND